MKNHRKLGVTNGRLAAMPSSPNAVSSQTGNRRQYVEPLPMAGNAIETRKRIIESLRQMGGNTIKSQTDSYIHAVFTSAIMRFKDDVEFYIDEQASLVHFRSASRVGHSDLGANRRRYKAFKAFYAG
ncbi:MAG: DUF1499 domain-containing protein [Gammaproteobacteria bacterium]|nr:DUF1499 domain-containing protein [Gammaproteobacteria bacterium]